MSNLIIDNYIIKEPIINILNKLKSELNNGKLNIIESNGRVSCPHHKCGKEQNPSCNINMENNSSTKSLEYGYCHCFTCGFKGPLWHFVAECFDRPDSYGKEWLINNFGIDIGSRGTLKLEPIVLKKHIEQTNKIKTLNPNILTNMQSYHPYMEQRKLTRQVCEQFEVKYDPITRSIVFPVWDENNNLVMLTRRSVEKKNFYIQKDVEKPVYLLNYIIQNNNRVVCVCESQINTLYLWSLGYPAIGLLGTGTQHQYEVLNKSPIRHYILCLDGDEAGDKGVERFTKNIRKDVFVDVVKIPRTKDVNDLSKSKIKELLSEYLTI